MFRKKYNKTLAIGGRACIFIPFKLAAKFTDTRQNNIPHIMTESPNGCALFPPTSKRKTTVP